MRATTYAGRLEVPQANHTFLKAFDRKETSSGSLSHIGWAEK